MGAGGVILTTIAIVGFVVLFAWTLVSGERRHREERRLRKAALEKLDREG